MNVEFNKKKIKDLMEELKDGRPIFDSEDDFKFSLAWLIKEKYRNHIEIRLEKKMNNNKDASSSWAGDKKNKNQRIDIFIIVKNNKEKIGIELKYFTAKIEWRDNKNEETFILADQYANDIKCYDAWKDVERLEDFIDKGFIKKGFVIWLTNINALSDNDNSNKDNYYYQFRISNGRKIPDADNPKNPEKGYVELKWDEDASEGTKKRREDPIKIKKNYNVYWEEYKDLSNELKKINEKSSNKKNSNKVFKYAILEVQ
jgi:hypothetical protein